MSKTSINEELFSKELSTLVGHGVELTAGYVIEQGRELMIPLVEQFSRKVFESKDSGKILEQLSAVTNLVKIGSMVAPSIAGKLASLSTYALARMGTKLFTQLKNIYVENDIF